MLRYRGFRRRPFPSQFPRKKIFCVKSADRKSFEYLNDITKFGVRTMKYSSAYGNLHPSLLVEITLLRKLLNIFEKIVAEVSIHTKFGV